MAKGLTDDARVAFILESQARLNAEEDERRRAPHPAHHMSAAQAAQQRMVDDVRIDRMVAASIQQTARERAMPHGPNRHDFAGQAAHEAASERALVHDWQTGGAARAQETATIAREAGGPIIGAQHLVRSPIQDARSALVRHEVSDEREFDLGGLRFLHPDEQVQKLLQRLDHFHAARDEDYTRASRFCAILANTYEHLSYWNGAQGRFHAEFEKRMKAESESSATRGAEHPWHYRFLWFNSIGSYEPTSLLGAVRG